MDQALNDGGYKSVMDAEHRLDKFIIGIFRGLWSSAFPWFSEIYSFQGFF